MVFVKKKPLCKFHVGDKVSTINKHGFDFIGIATRVYGTTIKAEDNRGSLHFSARELMVISDDEYFKRLLER